MKYLFQWCLGCMVLGVTHSNGVWYWTKVLSCHTRTGHTELSAIVEHVHSAGANMHWKAHTVTREGHTLKRKVKEALAIHRLGRAKAMNQDYGPELSKLWLDAINQ